MARRSKLTRQRVDRIVDLVRAGNYAKIAAQASGISEPTYYRWLEQGRKDVDAGRRTLAAQLLERVEEASALAESQSLMLIRQAGYGGDWKASAWYLERRHPDRYSRRSELVQVGGEGDREGSSALRMVDELQALREEIGRGARVEWGQDEEEERGSE